MSVHGSHCCKLHGCKYGKTLCPVVLGTEEQLYPCENCDDEGIESLEDLKNKIAQDPKKDISFLYEVIKSLMTGGEDNDMNEVITITEKYGIKIDEDGYIIEEG